MTVGSPAEEARLMGLDWDGDGEITSAEDRTKQASGVFWSGTEPTNRAFPIQRLDLGDGASNTLMISERNKLRDWAVPPPQTESDLAAILRLPFLAPLASHGFGIGTASFRDATGWHVMPCESPWSASPSQNQLRFERMRTIATHDCSEPPGDTQRIINSPSTFYLAPMSDHYGGVNVAFCDGAVSFMSEDVAPDVFARLLTSAGSSHGQSPLSDSDF
ncbi:MAG: DUF1559 domain-containing protein [Planctomycetaceae bacterium]